MIVRRLTLALAVMASPVLAVAQGWEFNTFDDGSYFSAAIRTEPGPAFALLCGERSPRGLSPQQTGNMEPDITRPDSVRLFFDDAAISGFDGATLERQDVLLVVGSTGYRLPTIIWDELFSAWQTDLQANDPVFNVIAGQPEFELRSADRSVVVPANGFGAAFAQLTAHCQAMFTAIGKPWATVPAAQPSAPVRAGMREVAEASIRTGCGGPAQLDANAILTGNIDGDGREDVVVDWSAITCSGGYPRPFCGAAMCSATVFVSQGFDASEGPADLLAAGVRLIDLNNGNNGVVTGGSLSMCQQRGTTSCDFIWYWDGNDLRLIE